LEQAAPLNEPEEVYVSAWLAYFLALGGYRLSHRKWSFPSKFVSPTGLTPDGQDVRRIVSLAQQGLAGKAAALAAGDSRIRNPAEPGVAELLRACYPAPYGLRRNFQPAVPADPCPTPDDAQFRRTLWNICQQRCGKAGGPSGWTFNRCTEVWNCRGDLACSQFLDIARFVRLFLTGALDTDLLRDFFTRQKGLAFSKPPKSDSDQEGVRPIGITECFTRLAGAFLMRTHRTDLLRVMEPDCYGFGASDGSSLLGYSIRSLLREHPDWVWLHTDFKNAFNTLDRNHVADFARRNPRFAPYLQMIYGHTSQVCYSAQLSVPNAEGVIQGMPESAAVFEAVIQPIVRQVRLSHPGVRILGQYDDHHILGDAKDVLEAFLAFAAAMEAEFRLTMQFAKCVLFSASPIAADDQAAYRAHGVTIRDPTAPADHGEKAAGVPIGSAEFLEREVSQVFGAAEKLLTRLGDALNFPPTVAQPSMRGLLYTARVCVTSLTDFTLRTICCSVTRPLASRLARALETFILCLLRREDLVDEREAVVGDRELLRWRIFLGVKKGGIGLPDGERLCAAAVVGFLRRCGPNLQSRLSLFTSPSAIALCLPELSIALDHLRSQHVDLPAEWVAMPSFFRLEPAGRVQAGLMDASDEHRRLLLVQRLSAEASQREALLGLLSAMGDHSGALLTSSPRLFDTDVADNHFRISVSLRLGITPALLMDLPSGPFACPLCSKPCSAYGLHALGCTKLSHIPKHNDIEATLAGLCREARNAGLSVVTQPRVATFLPRNPAGPEHESDLIADLLIETAHNGRRLVDVAQVLVSHSDSLQPGSAARRMTKTKEDKYRAHFIFSDAPHAIKLVPFVVETFGRMNKEALELLTWLGHLKHPLQQVDGSVRDLDGLLGSFMARAYTRIAAALAHGVGSRFELWRSRVEGRRTAGHEGDAPAAMEEIVS
jgi:hypothetical protein